MDLHVSILCVCVHVQVGKDDKSEGERENYLRLYESGLCDVRKRCVYSVDHFLRETELCETVTYCLSLSDVCVRIQRFM